MAGYFLAKNSKVTAEKVNAYVQSVDLSKLPASDRAKAIKELADRINAMSFEERRKARLEQAAAKWFDQMTEAEKGAFIEATMPTGFTQMLNAFEQMPEDQRRKTINDALKGLREAEAKIQAAGGEINQGGPNAPMVSPELQEKIRTVGLATFYAQSSAQTKAELAPVLEELQRVMESGQPFHNHR
jgi:hypothetical protein